jgi:hypothetical protein
MAMGHASRFSLLIATIEAVGGGPEPPAAPAQAPAATPEAPACALNLPAQGKALGEGAVERIEDHGFSMARVAKVEQGMKAKIDPDYAETPRVVVELLSGETMAAATTADMHLRTGDRVEVTSLARSPNGCHYLPVRVSKILGAAP